MAPALLARRRMTLRHMVTLAFVLTGCEVATVAPADLDPCTQFDAIAGHSVTLPVHLDTHVLVYGESLGSNDFCATATCTDCARWWVSVACPDRYIAFVPGDHVGLDIDLGTTGNFFCIGPGDGTPQGGASCEPTECSRLSGAWAVSHVRSVTGVLQSTPRPDRAIDGRPIYWFAMESFESVPYDAAEDCDPAVPRLGCPCMGVQTLCPFGLSCGTGATPTVWTTYPDICGIG